MKEPVRLAKQENNSHLRYHFFSNRVEEWLLSHSTLCLTILLALLCSLFVLLCFAICGVSAVESGTQYRMGTWI